MMMLMMHFCYDLNYDDDALYSKFEMIFERKTTAVQWLNSSRAAAGRFCIFVLDHPLEMLFYLHLRFGPSIGVEPFLEM